MIVPAFADTLRSAFSASSMPGFWWTLFRLIGQFTPVLALYDPFGVDVPLNFDISHTPPSQGDDSSHKNIPTGSIRLKIRESCWRGTLSNALEKLRYTYMSLVQFDLLSNCVIMHTALAVGRLDFIYVEIYIYVITTHFPSSTHCNRFSKVSTTYVIQDHL